MLDLSIKIEPDAFTMSFMLRKRKKNGSKKALKSELTYQFSVLRYCNTLSALHKKNLYSPLAALAGKTQIIL